MLNGVDKYEVITVPEKTTEAKNIVFISGRVLAPCALFFYGLVRYIIVLLVHHGRKTKKKYCCLISLLNDRERT